MFGIKNHSNSTRVCHVNPCVVRERNQKLVVTFPLFTLFYATMFLFVRFQTTLAISSRSHQFCRHTTILHEILPLVFQGWKHTCVRFSIVLRVNSLPTCLKSQQRATSPPPPPPSKKKRAYGPRSCSPGFNILSSYMAFLPYKRFQTTRAYPGKSTQGYILW